MLAVAASALQLHAQTNTFTYQGQLMYRGVAVNGLYDITFLIYDAAAGGIRQGPVLRGTSEVTNGLFMAVLDFGTDVFIGDARWLEIRVRNNGGNAFTT